MRELRPGDRQGHRLSSPRGGSASTPSRPLRLPSTRPPASSPRGHPRRLFLHSGRVRGYQAEERGLRWPHQHRENKTIACPRASPRTPEPAWAPRPRGPPWHSHTVRPASSSGATGSAGGGLKELGKARPGPARPVTLDLPPGCRGSVSPSQPRAWGRHRSEGGGGGVEREPLPGASRPWSQQAPHTPPLAFPPRLR